MSGAVYYKVVRRHNVPKENRPDEGAESPKMTPQLARLGPLSGRRVLVVEDEYFLADDIARALIALGAEIVGPVGEVNEAAGIVDGKVGIDAAIVDINLHSEMIFPVVRTLRARKVPLVFTTGYDKGSINAEFHDVLLWEKPLDIPAMARDLATLIGGGLKSANPGFVRRSPLYPAA